MVFHNGIGLSLLHPCECDLWRIYKRRIGLFLVPRHTYFIHHLFLCCLPRCHEIQPAVSTQHCEYVCTSTRRIHRRAADGDDRQVSSQLFSSLFTEFEELLTMVVRKYQRRHAMLLSHNLFFKWL